MNSLISDYNTELKIDMKLHLPKGKYLITKYSFDEFNNYFRCLANMNFTNDLPDNAALSLNTLSKPYTELYETQIDVSYLLTNYFSGAGVQFSIIQKL